MTRWMFFLVISVALSFFSGCDLPGEDHGPSVATEMNAFAMGGACPADLSEDGGVGMADLIMLLVAWGSCSGCLEDLDDDQNVGMSDLTGLLEDWGSCPNECVYSAVDSWQNYPLGSSQDGLVTVTFDATPQPGMTESIVALGPSSGAAFGDFANLVRFSSAGKIDVRNGGTYAANVDYSYTHGSLYEFRLEINVPTHRYSVYVTGPDDQETQLVGSSSFRSEQSSASSLTHWATWSDGGTMEVCNFSVQRALFACEDGIDNDDDGLTDLDDAGCSSASDTSEVDHQSSTMGCPSEAAIQAALSGQLQWFDPGLSGGAHSWVFNGAEFGKAATSFCGDTRTDDPLLDQIRNLLNPGNGVSATGGFQDQKQLGATSMFTLAKQMPRIWDQLSSVEKTKIDYMMRGVLVSSSFTTSDSNWFIVNGQPQHSLNGGTDMNRSWNPNHRNGMIGQVIVASLYFGLEQATNLLATHDHDQFVSELQALNLQNLVWTYTRSNGVSASQVEFTLHQPFSYFGVPHDDIMGMFTHVTEYTYSGTVQCGLNNNQGVASGQGGYMVQGCNALPNKGQPGMLYEFDAYDGYGQRSSSHYAHDGWYVNNYIHYIIAALGYWEYTPASAALLSKIEIGTRDLEYKLDVNRGGGYYDYSNGSGGRPPEQLDYQQGSNEWGHRINFSIVLDVLLPFHG